MNCKNCGNLIDKEANFCPYCGKIMEKEENSKEYNDPFKELRIDNSHNDQYQYQQNYSNESTSNEINFQSKNHKSLIGLLLGIVSIFISWIDGISICGIVIAIVSLILAITGIKKTSKGLGIAAIIVTIFTLIITIVTNILMFVGSIELTFINGYTISIKDYLIDAFFCGYNEDKIQGYWLDNSNELLYLDDEGNYYIYLDANERIDNYYYGTYIIEDGLSLNSEETIYADNNYYLYEINTLSNKSKMEGTIYNETTELIENGFTLKLDKKDKNHLILVGNDGNTEIEFQKE